jgi:hypothetical protein
VWVVENFVVIPVCLISVVARQEYYGMVRLILKGQDILTMLKVRNSTLKRKNPSKRFRTPAKVQNSLQKGQIIRQKKGQYLTQPTM